MTTATFQDNLLSLQSNLLNFAMMLTSNREHAYDLLQDTTLRALDSQDKFTEGTNFKGWVMTIMRNIFINNYRRTVFQATVVDTTENLYHLNISQASGLEAPEGSVSTHEISHTINDLPADLRKPFSMYVSGYKYDEIAEILGQPIGTVKTHIHHARKRLQSSLADYR